MFNTVLADTQLPNTHTHTHTHTHNLLSLFFLLGDFTIYTSSSIQIKKSLTLRKDDEFGLRIVTKGFQKTSTA